MTAASRTMSAGPRPEPDACRYRSARRPSPRGSGSGARAGTRAESARTPAVSCPRRPDQRLGLENNPPSRSATSRRNAPDRSGTRTGCRRGARRRPRVRSAARIATRRQRDGVARHGAEPWPRTSASGPRNARRRRGDPRDRAGVSVRRRGGPVAERGTEPRPERSALSLAAPVPENLHGTGPRRDAGAPVRGGIVHHDHGAVRAKPLDDAAQRPNLVEDRDDGPQPVVHAAAFRSRPKGRSTSATWVPPRARPWTSAGADAPSGRDSGRTTNRRS